MFTQSLSVTKFESIKKEFLFILQRWKLSTYLNRKLLSISYYTRTPTSDSDNIIARDQSHRENTSSVMGHQYGTSDCSLTADWTARNKAKQNKSAPIRTRTTT